MGLDVAGSAVEKFLLRLRNSAIENNLSHLSQGNWVVDVLVVKEPLIGEVSAAVSDECLVHREDVLHAALIANVVVCSVQSLVVFHLDGQREPALTELWVGSIGHVEVCIDLSHQLKREIANTLGQSVKEDNLELNVVSSKISGIVGRA